MHRQALQHLPQSASWTSVRGISAYLSPTILIVTAWRDPSVIPPVSQVIVFLSLSSESGWASFREFLPQSQMPQSLRSVEQSQRRLSSLRLRVGRARPLPDRSTTWRRRLWQNLWSWWSRQFKSLKNSLQKSSQSRRTVSARSYGFEPVATSRNPHSRTGWLLHVFAPQFQRAIALLSDGKNSGVKSWRVDERTRK